MFRYIRIILAFGKRKNRFFSRVKRSDTCATIEVIVREGKRWLVGARSVHRHVRRAGRRRARLPRTVRRPPEEGSETCASRASVVARRDERSSFGNLFFASAACDSSIARRYNGPPSHVPSLARRIGKGSDTYSCLSPPPSVSDDQPVPQRRVHVLPRRPARGADAVCVALWLVVAIRSDRTPPSFCAVRVA